MNNILLLDGDTVQAVSVAQALKTSAYRVSIFCSSKISYGYSSKYPDKKVIAPSIKSHPDQFISFLLNYIRENKIDIIIPLYDDSAQLMNDNRNKIAGEGARLALPKEEVFNLAGNKSSLMEFCLTNGFPHPKTVLLDNFNLRFAAEKVGFPALLKPQNSSGAVGIEYLDSFHDLETKFSIIEKKYGSLSLQSYVDHSGYYFNAMLYRTKDGKFSKTVVVKIKRYFPLKGGTGTYSETVEYPEIEILCQKILKELNYVGFADFDFIVDRNTNEPKLIEINPRIPACIKAALVSGINFPEIIISDLLNNTLPPQSYKPNKKIRFLALDILWFIFSKNRFRIKPRWFQFFEKELYYQDGSFKDPLPMLVGFFMGLRKYLNPAFRQSKLKNV